MNKLFKNGLAILLTLAMLICQGTVFAVEGDMADGVKSTVSAEVENYVKAFGIFGADDIIDNSEVTRAQAADYFVKAAGFDYGTVGGAAAFSDVAAGSFEWKVSEAALMLGIATMNEEKMFYPGRTVSLAEAMTMAVRTMKCEPIAKLRGGYPNGYMEIARESYLLNGISGGAAITKADMACIVYNMHKADMYEITYEGDRISYKKNANKTVAEELLGVKKYRVEFIGTSSASNTITVKFTGVDKRGQTEEYVAGKNVDISKIGGSGYIYVDNDTDEIVFVEIKKGSDVQYDYISEVNKLETNYAVNANDIKYLTLLNADTMYEVSEDAVFYYEDELVTTRAINYLDSFAKVVIQDGEIVRVDAYPLEDGGLVRYATHKELRFDVSEDVEHWYELDTFNSLEIFIDGIKAEGLVDLKENYVFDYWYDQPQNKMLIVASSRAAYGTMTGYKANKIMIDGVQYDIDVNKCMNYDVDMGEYKAGVNYREIAGQKVTVYFSDDMEARYIHIDTVNVHKNVVRGVITNAWEEKGTGDEYLKIFHIDDSTGEHTYKVSEKLRSDSLSFSYAKSVSKDYEGGGFLEFTLDGSNEIKHIGYVKNFGYAASMSGMLPEKYVICGQYVQEAKWFLILNINGEFTVRKTTWSDMQYMTPVGTARFISDYDQRENPVPEYFLGLGWEDSVTAFDSYGFINDIQYVDDEYSKLIFAGTTTLNVKNSYIEQWGIKIGSYLKYRRTRGGENPLIIYEVKDFSGDSSTWPVDTWTSESTTGLFGPAELVYSNDYIAQFEINGEITDTYMFNDTGIVDGNVMNASYRHNRNSFDNVTAIFGNSVYYTRTARGEKTQNLRKGDKIWFHLSNKKITWFIFEDGPNSYER